MSTYTAPLDTSTTTLDAGQRAVLESIARGVHLQRVLNDIVLLIERQAPGMLCSILLLEDGKRLRHGAAPHIPEAYARAIDGSKIGPAAGSCGTAAFTGERVIVENIATHPHWKDYRQFALPYGLRSCWSTPILGPNREVLGTFAMYYHDCRGPAPREIEWVDVATHLASIAILRHRTEQALRRSELRARELTRLHAVASSINKQIVRAGDSQNLYDLACRIAVEQGLARLAWLGIYDENKRSIELIAQYGSVPFFDTRTFELDDPRNRGSPADLVVTTGQPQVAGDLPAEGPVYWRDAFAERGLSSCALLPLKDRDRIFGVFALYAEARHYFRDEEVQVLTSLAADISFAVESARNQLERQRMQEAVRASENLRALIHATVTDAIFYLQVEEGARYRFMSVNRAFTELFGAPEQDIVGKVLNDRLPESIREPILERYRTACATHEPVTWEQVVDARSGTKHVELTITPIYDASGRCTNFVGTIHDITARVQAEAERARLVSQLNQVQRMQSLGTLAGGIAHDFNNILAAISGNAGLALQEPTLDESTRTHLLEIQKAGHRAIELVRQILTFSRHAPPKRERVDAVEVTREALNMVRATLSQTIALESTFAPDTPRFEGDPTQFHQIVMNLVTNAAHALPERGGLIRVQVEGVRLAEDSEIANLNAGDYLRLTVTDNGSGMDEATLKRAFDPFFTTRRPGEGTGLGLSVVHGIVQNHRGGVHIRSRVNEGTTVSVYLPTAGAQAAEPAASTVTPGHGERVMYVDDEEALVFLVERALRKTGYRVSGFADPAAALSALRARPQEFDVIVTDISMPGLSGPDLATEARRIRPGIPIIMTSGYIRPEDTEIAERLQVNQLVYKANTIEELGQALAKEIDALTKRRDSSGAAP